jgi:hypothetical protein
MYRLLIPALALFAATGCVMVHASLPEELMDNVTVQIDDIQIGAICTHAGKAYSEGSTHCMGGQRMRCQSGSGWVENGEC